MVHAVLKRIAIVALAVVLLAWTAQLVAIYTTPTPSGPAKQLTDGRLLLHVDFTGNAGEPSIPADFYGVSAVDLTRQVLAFLAQLNSGKTDSASFQAGVQIAAPAVVTSPAATARDIFLQDYFKLCGLARATDPTLLGTTLSADPAYLSIQAAVKAEYKTAYLPTTGGTSTTDGWPICP